MTVPSVTDSPSAGIVTIVPEDDGTAATAGATGATGAGATGATSGCATTGFGVSTTAAGAGGVAGAEPESAITANSAPTATV